MQSLNIGLSSWIIQDGNYEDFSVGDTRQFALDFYSKKRLRKIRDASLRMSNATAETYDICAQVKFVDGDVWVLDCGVQVFREEHPPARVSVGEYVEGRISVGIDPFFYKENLHRLPGMPKIAYCVEVGAISIETTPRVRVFGVTQRRGKRTFRAIARTDALKDDDSHAHYILHCNLIPGDPP